MPETDARRNAAAQIWPAAPTRRQNDARPRVCASFATLREIVASGSSQNEPTPRPAVISRGISHPKSTCSNSR